MTEEERAEKHIDKKLCSLCREEKSKTKCATCSTFMTAYICYLDGLAEGRKETAEKISELEKENKELKSHISTLLSCSNCPDNKGGYICDKEYNNKCLAQKIQYINELKKQLELKKC